MKITITEANLIRARLNTTEAERFKACHCLISDAIFDAIGEPVVSAGRSVYYLANGGQVVSYDREVRKLTFLFDDKKDTEIEPLLPYTFDAEVTLGR